MEEVTNLQFPMANVEAAQSRGYFSRRLCRLRFCHFNSAGIKVSDWWLFLFLSYVGSLLVGTVFVVTGFASTDFQMSAVGVVLVIAGACLAVVCDLLRRFGCGWTKMATEAANSGRIIQSDSDYTISIPYLPGYPGFNTAVDDRRPDNPPPYEISGESRESTASSATLTCTCGTCLRAENAPFSDAGRVPSFERHPTSMEAQPDEMSFSSDNFQQLPREHVASNITFPRGGFYPRTIIKPSPPPYDFVVVNSAGNISYLYDSPPPYGDFV